MKKKLRLKGLIMMLNYIKRLLNKTAVSIEIKKLLTKIKGYLLECELNLELKGSKNITSDGIKFLEDIFKNIEDFKIIDLRIDSLFSNRLNVRFEFNKNVFIHYLCILKSINSSSKLELIRLIQKYLIRERLEARFSCFLSLEKSDRLAEARLGLKVESEDAAIIALKDTIFDYISNLESINNKTFKELDYNSLVDLHRDKIKKIQGDRIYYYR